VPATDDADDEAVIREQIRFYRRMESYGDAMVDLLGDDVLARCPPSAACLELAAGSGSWTRRLLDRCERITAVDSSPERIAVSRARIADPRVEYVGADLFEFRTSTRFDMVFAGFWLSHVPPARFEAFWAMVADALAPGGSVVLVDDGVRDASGAHFLTGPDGSGAERRLPDGEAFTIVKVAHAPAELEAALAALGWTATVTLLTSSVYLVEAHR
jgi:hypothetical protein